MCFAPEPIPVRLNIRYRGIRKIYGDFPLAGEELVTRRKNVRGDGRGARSCEIGEMGKGSIRNEIKRKRRSGPTRNGGEQDGYLG